VPDPSGVLAQSSVLSPVGGHSCVGRVKSEISWKECVFPLLHSSVRSEPAPDLVRGRKRIF